MVNKALLFGGLTVGVAGTGVGSYFLLRNPEVKEKTIEELLDVTTKGKKITTANKGGAAQIKKWADYITKHTTNTKVADSDIFEMETWSTEKGNKAAVPDKFIEACDKQLKIKVKDKEDEKVKNYIDYCTA